MTIRYKLNEAFKNGYDGILFWSLNGQDGFDFRSVADQYQTWFEK